MVIVVWLILAWVIFLSPAAVIALTIWLVLRICKRRQPVEPRQCTHCGYLTVGLPDPCCPECGCRIPRSVVPLLPSWIEMLLVPIVLLLGLASSMALPFLLMHLLFA